MYLDWSHTDLASYLASYRELKIMSSSSGSGGDGSGSGRVLGGEVAVWTESIDYTNLDCRLWPRGGAAAAG